LVYIIALFVIQNNLPSGDFSLYIPFRVCGALLFLSRSVLVFFTVVLIRNYGKGLIALTSLQPDKNLIGEEDEQVEDYIHSDIQHLESTENPEMNKGLERSTLDPLRY